MAQNLSSDQNSLAWDAAEYIYIYLQQIFGTTQEFTAHGSVQGGVRTVDGMNVCHAFPIECLRGVDLFPEGLMRAAITMKLSFQKLLQVLRYTGDVNVGSTFDQLHPNCSDEGFDFTVHIVDPEMVFDTTNTLSALERPIPTLESNVARFMQYFLLDHFDKLDRELRNFGMFTLAKSIAEAKCVDRGLCLFVCFKMTGQLRELHWNCPVQLESAEPAS